MVIRKPPSPKSLIGERDRIQAEECAKLVSLTVQHAHTAGIDVADSVWGHRRRPCRGCANSSRG